MVTAQTEAPPTDPDRLRAARSLVEAMRLRDRFAEAFGDTGARDAGEAKLLADCMGRNADPATPDAGKGDCLEKLARFRQRVAPIRARLAPAARGRLVAAAAETYAALFSAQELGQITDFYRSPVGRRLAEVAPVFDKRFREASTDVELQFAIDVLGAMAEEQAK